VRRLSLFLLSIVASVVISGPVLAWGPEGHAIVAEIAEARLTTAAAKVMAQLLAQDGVQHLDQIASWADIIRPSHPETGPWHFVDIPLSAQGYDATRDCPGGNCVVEQIQRWSAVLGDVSAPPRARLEALKYVVHFVGDIHQPLHCETNFASHPPPIGDRGGNDVHLTYFGRSTNLHAVWDSGIIQNALRIPLGPNSAPDLEVSRGEAARFERSITAADATAWAPFGLAAHLAAATVQWANESHTLAQQAYLHLPADPMPARWEETYQSKEWPIVQNQLWRAGLRLAELLNEKLY
jgi:S1/P1 Nuclease